MSLREGKFPGCGEAMPALRSECLLQRWSAASRPHSMKYGFMPVQQIWYSKIFQVFCLPRQPGIWPTKSGVTKKKKTFLYVAVGSNETNPPNPCLYSFYWQPPNLLVGKANRQIRRACLHTHEVVVHEKVSHNECQLPLVDDHRLETDPASVDQSCLCCSFPKHPQKRTSGGCFSSDLAYDFSIYFSSIF